MRFYSNNENSVDFVSFKTTLEHRQSSYLAIFVCALLILDTRHRTSEEKKSARFLNGDRINKKGIWMNGRTNEKKKKRKTKIFLLRLIQLWLGAFTTMGSMRCRHTIHVRTVWAVDACLCSFARPCRSDRVTLCTKVNLAEKVGSIDSVRLCAAQAHGNRSRKIGWKGSATRTPCTLSPPELTQNQSQFEIEDGTQRRWDTYERKEKKNHRREFCKRLV